MTTRYELIAVEQPGTNVKALHLAYQAFVDKLNDLYDRQVKNGESDWWSHFSDPQVHIIDNNIVVFAIMTNVPDELEKPLFTIQAQEDDGNTHERVVIRGIFPERTLEVEPLPFDEPPVPEPSTAWIDDGMIRAIPGSVYPKNAIHIDDVVVEPPKRKRGRPRKTE